METGSPDDKMMKEMGKEHEHIIIHQADVAWNINSNSTPRLAKGQRSPSDLNLSRAEDVAETSVISTRQRLWPAGTRVE